MNAPLTRIIYALVDPVSDEIRYVGLSVRGMTRPREHLEDRPNSRLYVYRWINKLKSAGYVPEIAVLEVFDKNGVRRCRECQREKSRLHARRKRLRQKELST